MKTLDWAKLAATAVVLIAGSCEFGRWKEGLRAEGEIRVYQVAVDSVGAVAEALADSLELVKVASAAEVSRASASADSAHRVADLAQQSASRIRQDRTQLVDSILRTTEHVAEVQAALEVQAESYEAELAEVRTEATSLRQAEADAWKAFYAEVDRRVAAESALDALQAKDALRDAIDERRGAAGQGHGWIVDAAIGAGGVVIGVLGMAAAGG